jgi:4-amino-4-deoxy-L-arabinose transferase-like glycosyltransferase
VSRPGKERRFPVWVWIIAGSVVALLLAVANRYGFHRDELYFIAAGRRLAWGYVDQPPFTPLIARAADILPGAVNPFLLRVLPALSVGTLPLMGAVLARHLGGGRAAMTFAALAAAGSGFFLGAGHLLSTAAFDNAIWVLVVVLVVRIVAGADPRWWLAVGAVIGIGLLNKHTILFLVIALTAALLLTAGRQALASMWPWIGAALAFLISLPNLLWQAANGWPQLEMGRALAGRSEGPIPYLLLQLAALSVFLIIPAVAGLIHLLRAERWRFIPIAYLMVFVAFLVAGGKFYYVAPLYVPLLAAGAIWLERLAGWWRRTVISLSAAGIMVGLPIALPLVPVERLEPFDQTDELGETVGWPQLIEQVAAVYQSIDQAARPGAVIFTSNYGEAGAIEVLGTDQGLPPVMSGHNSYWMWGPVDGDGPIIGVGPVRDSLSQVCPQVTQVATIDNGYGVENEEQGYPIYLCLQPTASLSTVWGRLRRYN